MNKKTNKYDYLIGQKSGLLTVLEILGTDPKHSHARVCRCVCECGKEATAKCRDIMDGKRKSCGCRAGNHKHNLSKHPLHSIWRGILTRCYNKNEIAYKNYGGRGITMCDSWRSSFINFYNDMLPGYKKGLTIDRINVDDNYAPYNCRWANRKEQSVNKRGTIMFEYNGVRKPMLEWVNDLPLTKNALYQRIRRGWSAADIINTPMKPI